MLEPFDLGKGRAAALQPQALHLIAEAEKLAYADRNRYLADPDFVAIPDGLLDPRYLAAAPCADRSAARRWRGRRRASRRRGPRNRSGAMQRVERAGTSHISIIDDDGNALAMTTTIEGGFGSHNWAAGFLLNNELTDFSFVPVDADGQPVANAVAAGQAPAQLHGADDRVRRRRPCHGRARLARRQPHHPLRGEDAGRADRLGLDAQAAADLLNFGSQGDGFEIELDRAAIWPRWAQALGHRIVPDAELRHHVIVRRGSRSKAAPTPAARARRWAIEATA